MITKPGTCFKQCLKHEQQCFIKFTNSRGSPRMFRLDKNKWRECFEQFKKRFIIGCFSFLIQLLIRMTFNIKSHVH